jgi:hypothetical protein
MSRELDEQKTARDEDWSSAQPADDLDDDESFEDYRSLSGMAVAALIIGLCSPLAFFAPIFLAVPLLGLALGVLAVLRIWRESEYYTGTGLAVTGALLSLHDPRGSGSAGGIY